MSVTVGKSIEIRKAGHRPKAGAARPKAYQLAENFGIPVIFVSESFAKFREP